MASFLASQTANSVRYSRASSRVCHRALHVTAVAQKKNNKIEIDDLFSEAPEEDLFSVEQTPAKDAVSATKSATSPGEEPAASKRSSKLSAEARAARFTKLQEFVTPRIGRKPDVKTPQVRNSAWVQMVQLATTEAQLKGVVDMRPAWIARGRAFDASFSELFVRRCEELRCPQLAVDVYGAYAKYGVPLSLPAGRQLLHSLHLQHPLSTTLTAAALYPVYNLPPVSEDLVSCALLTTACFHHAHVAKSGEGLSPKSQKAALKAAQEIAPQLEALLRAPATVESDKQNKWVTWSLKKIDAALKGVGEKRKLFEEWRTQHPETPKPSAA